jgi:hypothetical protein
MVGEETGKIFTGWWKKRIDLHVPVPFLAQLSLPRKMKESLSLRRLAERVLSSSNVVSQVPPTPTRRDFSMSRRLRYASSIFLAVALFSPIVFGGCAVRASYRVYDPSYEDYHVWGGNEIVYYQRWEVETHRDHRDFRKRHSDEQKEYWSWRHNHHEDKR